MTTMNLLETQGIASRIHAVLDRVLPSADEVPTRLHQAMRYSVLNGGKRFRAALVYSVGEMLGVSSTVLDIPAAAIECIHAYSLIHDDLPAMDNDDFRRGKPSCHKAFDEATAILAGDALQSFAFDLLTAEAAIAEPIRLRWVQLLSKTIGSQGMAGGQSLDLDYATEKKVSLETVEYIHQLKTSALIELAFEMAIAASTHQDDALLEKLRKLAQAIGMIFQLKDDLDDYETKSTLSELNMVTCLGIDTAKQKYQILRNKIDLLLAEIPSSEKVKAILVSI